MRYFILAFLAALVAPTNVNAGDWVHMARSENGYKSKEVGISKKECYTIKKLENLKAERDKYKLAYNHCFGAK